MNKFNHILLLSIVNTIEFYFIFFFQLLTDSSNEIYKYFQLTCNS